MHMPLKVFINVSYRLFNQKQNKKIISFLLLTLTYILEFNLELFKCVRISQKIQFQVLNEPLSKLTS